METAIADQQTLLKPRKTPAPAPIARVRSKKRIARLIELLRQRSTPDTLPLDLGRRLASARRLKKRKAALALSAGAMGLSTAASQYHPPLEDADAMQRMADARRPAVFLKASEELKEALIQEEGVRRTVYRDVAGYATVGVGHLVRPGDDLRVGDRVSEDRILDFLDRDLAHAESAIMRLVGNLPLHQNEFDALVDLVYNVGEGNLSEGRSPRLNQAIAMGDYQAIADELGYHHAGGEKARGLVYRSERRAQIFLDASYDDPRETGFATTSA